MNKIFEQAKDLHVVATYVYGNEDAKAYSDVECTKQFTTSELKEVFIKGALIVINEALYKAVNFVDGAIGYVNAAGEVETLASKADEVAE